jgi:urease accessory protein
MHGFMHPLGGLDHQLAMILVGVFAYQLGGRALWLVPLTFVGIMAVGGFLGIAGIPVPFIKVGIALSVIVLGAIVAFGVKIPVAAAMGIVGLFAIFHGHAHGSEMPLDASDLEHGLGFMLATASLHAVGVGIGFMIGMTTKWLGNNVYRVAGGIASVAALGILLGVFCSTQTTRGSIGRRPFGAVLFFTPVESVRSGEAQACCGRCVVPLSI